MALTGQTMPRDPLSDAEYYSTQAVALLDEALRAMSDFHASFSPANDADLTPQTTPAALRQYVDALASLHYRRHRL